MTRPFQRGRFRISLAMLAFAIPATSAMAAESRTIAGVPCLTPPKSHCGAECTREQLADQGNAIEPKTGRAFFLDYPCDLTQNEPVVFILSLHGAGSIGNWQRHYFPAVDDKDKYRLVIATPTAASMGTLAPGQPGVRMWMADADDEYLRNIVTFVFDAFGSRNIKSFWLAGHSQGGMTSNRIICTEFFKMRVDGWLSLSGGRIGAAQIAPDFFGPNGPPAALASPNGPRPGAASTPSCDFSYIFASGEREIVSLPDTSPWAQKYACRARVRQADIVDSKKGYVTGAAPGRGASWGREARAGTAQIFVYPKCKGHTIVADVLRLDKGHTEGLEPEVTEALIKLIVSVPGGKAQSH